MQYTLIFLLLQMGLIPPTACCEANERIFHSRLDFMQGIPGFGEVFRSPALESIIIVIGLLMLFFSAMKARFIFLGILTMIIGVLLLLPAVGVQMVMFEALSGSFINARQSFKHDHLH